MTKEGRFYARLFDLRQTGDYDDIYELTQEDVLDLIEPAEIYIRSIKELISS